MFSNISRPAVGWGLSRRAVTATTTVGLTDRGYTIDATSGTYDVALTAAATLGAGFCFGVYNSGSGVITINPAGAETIRSPAGSAVTLALSQGQGVLVMCDGAGFDVVADSGLAPTPGSVISGLTTGRIVDAASATTVETAAAIATDQSLSTTSTVASKQTTAAGISLDHNSATGNFTFRFSPANLTANRRATWSDADYTFTGGGTLALAGFTLTVPDTGTAMLLGTTQTATGDKTFSSGTLTVSSAAASTSQVVVAATAGQVAQFNIRGNNVATGLVVQHDGSSDATIVNFANRPLFIGTNASSNISISASPGDVSVLTATDATSSSAGSFKVSGGGVFAKNLLALQGSGRGLTSTPTAAATTTLTNASTVIQIFTGVTTQTMQLPAANLFGAGIAVEVIVINRSTGTVTAQRAGSDTFDGGGSSDAILTNTTRHYFSNGSNQWHTIS